MAETAPQPQPPRRLQTDNIHFIMTALKRHGLGPDLEEYLPDTNTLEEEPKVD